VVGEARQARRAPLCYDRGTMIRTRDFFLFLLVIAFLLVGIGAEIGRLLLSSPQSLAPHVPQFGDQVLTERTAVVVENAVDRPAQLAWWREQLRGFVPSTPPPLPPDPITIVSPETASATGPKRCSYYQTYTRAWQATGTTITEREGVRVVALPPSTNDGVETIVAILPIRTVVSSALGNCLPTDVIGIALDGSLIRNDETGLYGVFGAETLVGYTLDGFSLYGTTNETLDACGGKMTNMGYRYYVRNDREYIIGCFVSDPVTL
jgi:hypothetical protein